jgi:hypothetical protein
MKTYILLIIMAFFYINIINCQTVNQPNLTLNDFEKAFSNIDDFKAKLVENGFNFDRKENDEFQISEVWKYNVMRYSKFFDKDMSEWIAQVQISKNIIDRVY